MRLFFTILLNGLITSTLCAQGNPTNILMRTDTVRTCSARFTDNGGINENYAPNLNQTLVLCPPAAQHPDTNKIRISFHRMDLGTGDRLCIFDGIGTGAPALGCNSDFNNRMARATTANTSGCLTVTFLSNAADERSGWDANVTCDRPCQNFMGQIDYSSKPNMPADTGWIDLCVNEPLNLHAKGVYLQNNMPRSQADSTTNFEWNFGDGRLTTTGQTVQHSFSRSGGYILQLTLTDSATKCQNINTVRQRIRVAPKPIIQTARLSNPVCVNTPFRLNAVTARFDSTLYNIGVIAGADSFANGRRQRVDSFLLPDANGGSYNLGINVQGFPAGQTITSPNDIRNICLNMEHSWVRDLEIGIRCPNGQSVLLHNYTNASGNGWYLGQPNTGDGINPIPGIGWNYCWTPTATQTWRDYMTNVIPAPRTIPAGNYAPAQPFSNLVGCPLNGDWTVVVRDLWLGDNGFIFSWGIEFRDTLNPVSERFSPRITQHGWVNGVNITQNNGDSIIAVPRNAGVASFIYRVKDDFNCTHDTAIGIKVLPVQHPNCVSCAPRFNDLKDTTFCINELPLRFHKISLDTVPKSVTFESFPNKILSSLTNPNENPLLTPLVIHSLAPITLTDVYTQLDSVCIDLDSRYASDMVFKLKAPNLATPLILMNGPALASRQNLNICFSPNSTTQLHAATPTPYQGNYQITGGRSAWAAFNGATINGDWILQTSDLSGSNLDTLNRWSITFKYKNQIKYVWSPNTGLSCTDCPNPTANPAVTTTYVVQTIDSSRCTHRDTVQVTINGLPAPVVVLDSMLNGYMVFRWGAIAGAASYQVNVNNTGWVSANRVLGHRVTGLQPDVTVVIKVRGVPSVATSCDAAIGTLNHIMTNHLLDELSEKCDIQVYPNPLIGNKLQIELTFKQSFPNPLNLELRDGLGRLISNLGTVSETGRIERVLPDLGKGAYFLIFQSGHLKTVKSIYVF